MTTCIFVRSCAQPEATFASVAELAAHVHALRDGRPVVLKPAVLSRARQGHDTESLQALIVRLADTRETLGYAVIGELPSGVQFDRLGAALAALHREAA